MSAPPPATPGGERRAMSHRPEYVVEICISPQLRARDPGRALSLMEALEAGRSQRPEGPARTVETESPEAVGPARASRQGRAETEPEAELEP